MITRRDPFREALSLRHAMDQLLEQSFVPPNLMAGSSAMLAPMDVCETSDGYEVDVALPGARPEDIELTIDQNTLTIRGHYSHQDEHQNQPQAHAQEQQRSGQGESSTAQAQPSASQTGQSTTQFQTGQPAAQSQAVTQSQAGQALTQSPGAQQQQRHRQGHNWLLREMPSGSFERTITFSRPIDINHPQTRFENGILTILLPISEASRPKRISVTASQGQNQPPTVEAGH